MQVDPKVPEPILPSYLNSNSKYRRGLLTYCLFRLGCADSEGSRGGKGG